MVTLEVSFNAPVDILSHAFSVAVVSCDRQREVYNIGYDTT